MTPGLTPCLRPVTEHEGTRGSEPACCLNVVRTLEQDETQQAQNRQRHQAPAHLGMVALTPQPGELRSNDDSERREGGAGPALVQQDDAASQKHAQDDLQWPRQTHARSIVAAPAAAGSK